MFGDSQFWVDASSKEALKGCFSRKPAAAPSWQAYYGTSTTTGSTTLCLPTFPRTDGGKPQGLELRSEAFSLGTSRPQAQSRLRV